MYGFISVSIWHSLRSSRVAGHRNNQGCQQPGNIRFRAQIDNNNTCEDGDLKINKYYHLDVKALKAAMRSLVFISCGKSYNSITWPNWSMLIVLSLVWKLV